MFLHLLRRDRKPHDALPIFPRRRFEQRNPIAVRAVARRQRVRRFHDLPPRTGTTCSFTCSGGIGNHTTLFRSSRVAVSSSGILSLCALLPAGSAFGDFMIYPPEPGPHVPSLAPAGSETTRRSSDLPASPFRAAESYRCARCCPPAARSAIS